MSEFNEDFDFTVLPLKRKTISVQRETMATLKKEVKPECEDITFVEPTPPKKKHKKAPKVVNEHKQDFDHPIRDEPFYPELDPDSTVPILHQWFSVPRCMLTSEQLEKHLSTLSIVGCNVDYMTGRLPPPTLNFLLDSRFIHLPKYYGLKHYSNTQWLDKQRYGLDTDRLKYDEDKYPLDEEIRNQKSAFEAVHNALSSVYGGALLALPPGDGKTTVACYVMSKIGKVTLVAVSAGHISEQWVERIEQYLPGARIGRLQADIYDYEDKDVVICTVQSLFTDKYPKHVLDRFGLFVVDECHRKIQKLSNNKDISAKKFMRSLPLAMCRMVLCLSGTPKRKDRADVILSNFIGPITFQTKRTYVCSVRVKVIQPVYPPLKDKYNQQGKHHFALMMNDLADCVDRNEAIVDEIMTQIDTGYQMLILSSRRQHLKYLCDKVQERLEKRATALSEPNQNTTQSEVPQLRTNVTIGFILGGGKKKEQADAKNCQLIFSTYPMSAEALDIRTLRVVMLCTPKPDVVQSVARVLRGKDPSVEPLVIDFLEKKSIWANFWYQRRRYYLAEGFELQFVDGDDINQPEHFKSPKNVVFDRELEAEEKIGGKKKRVHNKYTQPPKLSQPPKKKHRCPVR